MKLVVGLVALVGWTAAVKHQGARVLEFVNESGETVSVEWLNPDTGKTIPYSSTKPGDRMTLNSFVNHTFALRRLIQTNETDTPSPDTAHPPTYVTVSEEDDDEQVIVVKVGLEVERLKQARQAAGQASDTAASIVKRCQHLAAEDSGLFLECVEHETSLVLQEKNEELAFQADIRQALSSKAENFTCADPTMTTSNPIEERVWVHGGVERRVGILHNRPSSQIHILKNFISAEECEAVTEAAKPLLHRGTVADGKGGSRMSPNRKAWQAGLTVDWETENPIAAVSRRLFDYTNEVTGYNMTLDGQEDLMSIQYFGHGEEDPTPDRYTPHCDGQCDGLAFKTGGRVATMVMYCDIPELGGSTNFQNSNVYVKPEVGAAAFFAYLNPETFITDKGFTSHSGCPVLKGTKRIAVQWMRIGVDSENPWDSFDTNTVKKAKLTET